MKKMMNKEKAKRCTKKKKKKEKQNKWQIINRLKFYKKR